MKGAEKRRCTCAWRSLRLELLRHRDVGVVKASSPRGHSAAQALTRRLPHPRRQDPRIWGRRVRSDVSPAFTSSAPLARRRPFPRSPLCGPCHSLSSRLLPPFRADQASRNDTHVLDLASASWEERSPSGEAPAKREMHAGLALPCGNMLIYGGRSADGRVLGDFYILVRPRWAAPQSRQVRSGIISSPVRLCLLPPDHPVSNPPGPETFDRTR